MSKKRRIHNGGGGRFVYTRWFMCRTAEWIWTKLGIDGCTLEDGGMGNIFVRID